MKKEGMRAILFTTLKASVQKVNFQLNPKFFFKLFIDNSEGMHGEGMRPKGEVPGEPSI